MGPHMLMNPTPEEEFDCKECNDTGEIEIYGGSGADDWGVVDIIMCKCKED